MLRSDCCKANWNTSFADEGTGCYICFACKKACDLHEYSFTEPTPPDVPKAQIDIEDTRRVVRELMKRVEELEAWKIVTEEIVAETYRRLEALEGAVKGHQEACKMYLGWKDFPPEGKWLKNPDTTTI